MNLNKILIWRYCNKDKLRNFLYFISVAFIGFFLFNIVSICQEMSDKENADLNINTYDIDLNTLNLNNDFGGIQNYKTYGEYIWEIILSLLQIIFLVSFILMLYINE